MIFIMSDEAEFLRMVRDGKVVRVPNSDRLRQRCRRFGLAYFDRHKLVWRLTELGARELERHEALVKAGQR